MAWSRTLFVMLIASLLCFRLGMADRSPLVLICAALLLGNTGLMAAAAAARCRLDISVQACTTRFHRYLIALTSITTTLTAIVLFFHWAL